MYEDVRERVGSYLFEKAYGKNHPSKSKTPADSLVTTLRLSIDKNKLLNILHKSNIFKCDVNGEIGISFTGYEYYETKRGITTKYKILMYLKNHLEKNLDFRKRVKIEDMAKELGMRGEELLIPIYILENYGYIDASGDSKRIKLTESGLIVAKSLSQRGY
jgi:hypothetical protein